MKLRLPKISRRTKIIVGAAAAFVATANASVKRIQSNEIGLRTTFGVASLRLLGPGLHFQFPFVSITHAYRLNTQTINFGAGSGRFLPFWNDTSDRNILVTDIRVQYKVVPDARKLSFWRWDMGGWGLTVNTGADGYWKLTSLINDSANAVFGRRAAAEPMYIPNQFANELYRDINFRFAQNNIPVQVESLEVKQIRTARFFPVRTVSYQVVGPAASSGPK